MLSGPLLSTTAHCCYRELWGLANETCNSVAEVTFDRGEGELMSGTSDDESHAVQRKLLAASAKNFAAMLDRQADACLLYTSPSPRDS